MRAEEICRAFAQLRYQLFPYTYTLAWEAHRGGVPLMRPLILEYPNDPNVVDMASEYLWGPSLLVAPVTRGGATHWPVYLPAGTWYDFWTGERFEGEQWVEADAPLEKMPLFVRGGAIIPCAPHLLVYAEGESSFVAYEDDGITRAYLRGGYSLTPISCSASDAGIHLHLESATRRPRIAQVYCPEPPREVVVRGAGPLLRVGSRAELDAAGGWWHDGNRFLWLRLSSVEGSVDIDLG